MLSGDTSDTEGVRGVFVIVCVCVCDCVCALCALCLSLSLCLSLFQSGAVTSRVVVSHLERMNKKSSPFLQPQTNMGKQLQGA